ncbi:MAG TPA: ISNCY family transposase [Terriglobales bacterium]|nr:ISNCY family transposase [Terriglobales bacterium]
MTRRAPPGATAVIKARHQPPPFTEDFLHRWLDDCWEDWMRELDRILDDEQLVEPVYEALSKRHLRSRNRGRPGTPAEVVLRLLVLKHIYNWSFDETELEVHASLLYRQLARVGAGAVPDAKTLARGELAVGPEVLGQIHRRLVGIAREHKIATGRKMRLDTTVVDTNIHYPTDSSLLGDGVRVLTRVMKKVNAIADGAGTQLRDRSRSVKLRVVEIARVSRSKSQQGQERMKKLYGNLLDSSGRVVGQARRFAQEIADGVKHSSDVLKQAALEGMKQELETMLERVKQVRRQTRKRVFGGDTHVEGKLTSIFEETTEVIRRGKASKPTEFGKMIKIQEAENQIITDFEVYAKRPADSELLKPAIQIHIERLGHAPDLVTGDAGFYSIAGEKAAQELGVKRVAVPNRSTKSAERRKLQKQRWFKQGQKWRTGCEGRISVLKRRHGLNRCRYKGHLGMRRWVGLGVICDTLINISCALLQKA